MPFDIVSGSFLSETSYNIFDHSRSISSLMNTQQFTVGSLFAGVGGICQAFRDAGFQILWANEIDANCRKTYELNHPEIPLTEIPDVRGLSSNNVRPIDILTAGFPCQPFSQAGQARGFNDERGHLFYEITRLLRELRPKSYFLENVKSLVNHNGGNTFSTIRSELHQAGYSFIPLVLKTSEYSDIPQGRERLYVVGFRDEAEFSYKAPVKENIGLPIGSDRAPLSSAFLIPPKVTTEPRGIRTFLEPDSVRNG